MDWDRAIERNREALSAIVAALFALVASARFAGPGMMLPRRVWLMVLMVMRPAEAAVRRLVVIAARALAPVSERRRAAPAFEIPRAAIPREPVFALFDPLKDRHFGDDDPVWQHVLSGGPAFTGNDEARLYEPLDGRLLHHRLRALRHALADLGNQARRLARWQARRDAALKACRPTRLSPMRPVLPPGWRERKIHEIDDVLRECHGLANDLLNAPDTG